jgi:hypothetical protein
MVSEYRAFLYNGDVLFLQTKNMKKNIGTLDRIIRILVAAILAGLYFANVVTGTWGIVLAVVAVALLITALIRFCGLYTLLGITTCKLKK